MRWWTVGVRHDRGPAPRDGHGIADRYADERRALESWQRADPVELEERIAHELATAPHADVLVGIPAEAKD